MAKPHFRRIRTLFVIAAAACVAVAAACSDDVSGPQTLGAGEFHATLSGAIDGEVRGIASIDQGTIEGTRRVFVVELEGRFPDEEARVMVVFFDQSLRPYAGEYALRPAWTLEEPLDGESVGVFLAERAPDADLLLIRYRAESGTLSVTAANPFEGAFQMTLTPSETSGAVGDLVIEGEFNAR